MAVVVNMMDTLSAGREPDVGAGISNVKKDTKVASNNGMIMPCAYAMCIRYTYI
jgi:hypothetical protein